jgi:hypothetical protein
MKIKLFYIVGGLAVMLIAAAIWQQYRLATNVKIDEVDSLIKNNIPIRTSKTDVIAFLDSTRIGPLKFREFGYQEDLSFLAYESGFFDDKNDKNKGIMKGYLNARIDNSTKMPLVQCDIQLRFYFDKNGQLIDYGIRRQCDGP